MLWIHKQFAEMNKTIRRDEPFAEIKNAAPVTSRRSADVPDAVGWFAQKLEELGVGDDNYYIHESICDGTIIKFISFSY